MCGRYTATDPEAILRELEPLGVDEIDADFELSPRYNVAPSQVVPVVATDAPNRLVPARWGLIPSWARRKSDRRKALINARAESAARQASFRDAVKSRRCFVVADGYYEWKREGSKKTPHHIRARSGRPFVFAGLWAPGAEDDPHRSFAILTTEADELVAPIHDRMPLILGPKARARWLRPGELAPADAEAILQNAEPPEMIAYPVSRAVGSPSVDAPSCIEPLSRQPSLFE